MLMEKDLEVPEVELLPDEALLVSLSFNSCPCRTRCSLTGAVLGPNLLGVAPFLAPHTSGPLKEMLQQEQQQQRRNGCCWGW